MTIADDTTYILQECVILSHKMSIILGFIVDPDPAFYLNAEPDPDPGSKPMRINADPDPGQTLPHKILGFYLKKYSLCR
jgi:hypothetical protein